MKRKPIIKEVLYKLARTIVMLDEAYHDNSDIERHYREGELNMQLSFLELLDNRVEWGSRFVAGHWSVMIKARHGCGLFSSKEIEKNPAITWKYYSHMVKEMKKIEGWVEIGIEN